MSAEQKHPYHLVDPSPWPLVTALSCLLLAWGFIVFMHEEKSLLFALGGSAVILSSILWWIDVVKESQSGLYHNKVVQIGLRYGMLLFIASEVMFFAAWFWAFFDTALKPREEEARRNRMSRGRRPLVSSLLRVQAAAATATTTSRLFASSSSS